MMTYDDFGAMDAWWMVVKKDKIYLEQTQTLCVTPEPDFNLGPLLHINCTHHHPPMRLFNCPKTQKIEK